MTEALSPEKLAEEGKTAYLDECYDDAAEIFLAAAEGYDSAGDLVMAAEMKNNCSVALIQAGDYEGALEAVLGTEQVFFETSDQRRQAMALGNLGAAYEGLARFEEAIEAYEKASDLFQQLGESELRAPVLKSLSRIKLNQGRGLEAVSHMSFAIDNEGEDSRFKRFFNRIKDFTFRKILKS